MPLQGSERAIPPCPHGDAITTGHHGFLNCLGCHREIPDMTVQIGPWTREQIEAIWDVFAKAGLELDRESMYYDEGADSEFCEMHRRRLAETLERAEVVPLGVSEALARAVSASLTHGEDSPLADALKAYLALHPWSDL